MRMFRLVIAAFILALATPVGAALPQLALACGSAAAGQDVPCTISRVSGGKGVYVLFQTSDGTAKAGLDYTALSKQVYLSSGTPSVAIAVHTSVNPNATGTLTFNAAMAGGVAVVRTTGSIVEPVLVPTPAPTAINYPVPSPNGLAGEFPIADNFNTADAIEPNANGSPPPTSPEAVGAFRMVCAPGQVAKNDPIVLPGKTNGSHAHQFTGNDATDANSTYASLRTTGGSKCGNGAVNRSSYWLPAMLDGAGNAVMPDYFQVYYKRVPASSPVCGPPDANHLGICTDLPNGIRYVTGYNFGTGTGGPLDTSSYDQYNIWMQCWGSQDEKVSDGGAKASAYHSIAQVVAAGCPAGAQLVIFGINPSCWDGKNLDTADHRSHMSNQIGPYVAAVDFNGCPADHPYLIPSLQIQYHYTTDANFVAGKWHLSSDDMLALMTGKPVEAGFTLHFDYWEGWSPTVKGTWMQTCINGHLTCSGGDLGNGTEIKNGNFQLGWPALHQTVPAP